ncbi:hypothetical protein JTE90_005627 [Oedothorax gibbosus]|uniref:Sugar transporter SWEET1 n=1 Tax=Oedothorax gibbosus TaxID=931172 RepID=A0AAV6UIP7_9ARAC|nr:hypothetical protein JTE90_005627 [Oedothorax gibbosus]
MILKNIIANVATFFTIGVFLAGIEICRKIWRKKSTCDISALPFVCGLVSTCLWLRYGLIIDDLALIIVNGTGACLQVAYLLFYSRYTPVKLTFYKQLSTALLIIGILYIFTTFYLEDDVARNVSGLTSCTAGVIFMASPLATVAHVVKTKSVESLPFWMIFCTFVMGTLWLCYGVLTNDYFVQVPNFLGAVLALSQLCLFAMYSNRKPTYVPLSTLPM